MIKIYTCEHTFTWAHKERQMGSEEKREETSGMFTYHSLPLASLVSRMSYLQRRSDGSAECVQKHSREGDTKLGSEGGVREIIQEHGARPAA